MKKSFKVEKSLTQSNAKLKTSIAQKKLVFTAICVTSAFGSKPPHEKIVRPVELQENRYSCSSCKKGKTQMTASERPGLLLKSHSITAADEQ